MRAAYIIFIKYISWDNNNNELKREYTILQPNHINRLIYYHTVEKSLLCLFIWCYFGINAEPLGFFYDFVYVYECFLNQQQQ